MQKQYKFTVYTKQHLRYRTYTQQHWLVCGENPPCGSQHKLIKLELEPVERVSWLSQPLSPRQEGKRVSRLQAVGLVHHPVVRNILYSLSEEESTQGMTPVASHGDPPQRSTNQATYCISLVSRPSCPLVLIACSNLHAASDQKLVGLEMRLIHVHKAIVF